MEVGEKSLASERFRKYVKFDNNIHVHVCMYMYSMWHTHQCMFWLIQAYHIRVAKCNKNLQFALINQSSRFVLQN